MQDRAYQIWERNALSVDIISRKVSEQKLDYIHNNPVQEKWQISEHAEDYKYSSIRFYEQENTEWDFLKRYENEI